MSTPGQSNVVAQWWSDFLHTPCLVPWASSVGLTCIWIAWSVWHRLRVTRQTRAAIAAVAAATEADTAEQRRGGPYFSGRQPSLSAVEFDLFMDKCAPACVRSSTAEGGNGGGHFVVM